ncbi:MAG TPA: hypothetical protein VFS43_15485 [Polyangiaceae bacterium]|nr:hypothetical protein [Polyangiaceae bacterium]
MKTAKGRERARRARWSFGDRLAAAGGVRVSPVCLGWVGRASLISEAYDAGINFFFLTADMHWPLYEAARRGLRDLLRRGGGVRDEIVVGVASYVQQPEFCHVPFREVVSAVPGLGSIDVTIAGGSYGGEFLVRLAQYKAHRLPGGGPHRVPGVRATGASFHDRAAALLALNHGLVDVAFARYNADHPGADDDLFAGLLPRDARPKSLLFNFNSTRGYVGEARFRELGLSADHWHPALPDYYRFALRRPEIDGILCGLRDGKELDALAAALRAGPVSDDEAAYMRDLAALSAGRRELA